MVKPTSAIFTMEYRFRNLESAQVKLRISESFQLISLYFYIVFMKV